MRNVLLMWCIVVVSLAGAACAAESAEYVDNVGIYLDEDGICNNSRVLPNVPTNAYLVFTQMSASTINAWEICITYGNVTLLQFTERNEHMTVSPRLGEYMCGLSSPQPVSQGTYVAADLVLMNNGYPGYIRGSGVYFHLLPSQVPCYTDAQDVPYELHSALYHELMVINYDHSTECLSVATESNSFGAVKAIFR